MTHKALVRRLQISCLGLDHVDPLRLLVDDVIEALRENAMREVQRLGQEIEQEPVACAECERLKDALKRANGLAEHFERAWYLRGDEIEELQAPMQEPVAIPDCGEAGHDDGACGNRECLPSFRHSTTPPQRKPLTDEEIMHCIDTHIGVPSPKYPLDNSDLISFARAIEAKLKEKNT